MNRLLFVFDSTTVLQEIAAYLKLLPPPGQSPSTDEKDKEFLLELLVRYLSFIFFFVFFFFKNKQINKQI